MFSRVFSLAQKPPESSYEDWLYSRWEDSHLLLKSPLGNLCSDGESLSKGRQGAETLTKGSAPVLWGLWVEIHLLPAPPRPLQADPLWTCAFHVPYVQLLCFSRCWGSTHTDQCWRQGINFDSGLWSIPDISSHFFFCWLRPTQHQLMQKFFNWATMVFFFQSKQFHSNSINIFDSTHTQNSSESFPGHLPYVWI